MWSHLIGWLMGMALLLAASVAAAAAPESRVALIIGNAAYRHASGLRNPINDAEAMAATLGRFGFDVVKATNADRGQMVRALSEFAKRLRPDGIGLFFYAGHGIQVGGNNFLIPVDADIQDEHDTSFLGINVNDVMRAMEGAGSRFNMMLLDACRDNPFERSFRSTAARGLAAIDAPRGALVAYATAPGKTAADGDGVNGLFTAELLKAMARTELPIDEVLKEAGAGVERASANKQVPWVNSSYRGKFFLDGSVAPVAAAPSVPTAASLAPTPEAMELAAWNAVGSGGAGVLQAFLKEFPDGRFAGMARAKLDEATRADAQSVSAPTTVPAIEARKARYVALQAARVRSDPNSRSLQLGSIGPGAMVEVTGLVSGKEWLQVSHDGRTGYVAAPLLREASEERAAASPVRAAMRSDWATRRAAQPDEVKLEPATMRRLLPPPTDAARHDGGWVRNQQPLPAFGIRAKNGRILGHLAGGDSVTQLVLEHPPHANRFGGGRVVQWSQVFRRDGEIMIKAVRKVSGERYPLVSVVLRRSGEATITWSAEAVPGQEIDLVEMAK